MAKYTDEQIKKAFEHCYEDDACQNCPLRNDMKTCDSLYGHVLAVINRQEAEIARIKGECFDCMYEAKITKSEAIKEFAQRLKALQVQIYSYDGISICHSLTTDDIDNLVKEMVGEGE